MKCGERGRKINMPLGRGEFQQVSGLNFLFKTRVASGFYIVGKVLSVQIFP